jgi:predicted phosphoribosyltransferase
MRFRDREDAARALVSPLAAYRGRKDVIILAIPRGGVVIGATLARTLELPLDVTLTKKLSHPENPEYAIGVVSLTRESIDYAAVARDHIASSYIERETGRIRKLLSERYRLYRGEADPPVLKGKTVILVDDGIATGQTMSAAVFIARREAARRIVVAVPIASQQAVEALRELADQVVCAASPRDFLAIGEFYERFDQVEDNEAVRLLRQSAPAEAIR